MVRVEPTVTRAKVERTGPHAASSDGFVHEPRHAQARTNLQHVKK